MRWMLLGLVGLLGACATAPPVVAVPWAVWGGELATRCRWSGTGIVVQADDAEVLIQPLVQCRVPQRGPVTQEVR